MTKEQFLQELGEALNGSVSPALVNENLRYYDEYIETEKRKGRSEDEVMDELGEPRLIARTIIDTADSGDKRGAEAVNDPYGSGYGGGFEGNGDPGIKYTRIRGWKVIAVLAAVIIIFLTVFTLAVFLVGSFIAAFWPAIIVAVVIYWILNPLRFD